ncbi:Clavaminate synthase-like protein [Mycena chlorophos]|uniref:Clavaminate synthase-like protein n=1 Tax=Mycena chlorophos TaxID=658473 RepID=A0A8H6TGU8_MYCCL|nr:Clavaminate synthase-like protein [Mycena chlorophos]KAF7318635.1 Clavaminate synthase-like protein [Mycena chlorophos]
MDSTDLPPFPDDIPTHPLLVIDYALLKAGDPAEVERLWTAATSLGFWYLKNHDSDDEVRGMFEMGAETMALPMEEKMRYEQGDDGISFGYKAAGANAVDASGTLDTAQFINVAKDDALAWPERARRAYPRTVDARMDSTIKPFVEKSLAVNMTLLAVFNEKLGFPEGTLAKQHLREEFSGSETRVLYSPPAGKDTQAIGAHTDFGSLSFLHNRLGGLQVFVPGAEEWQYVKPIPGHAICNIGDALAIFSGGILRSNLHRVVTPPGLQATHYRFSLVFFTRPGNSVVLRALKEASPIVADAVVRSPDPSKYDTGVTALEWFTRRIKNQRIKNRTGPETWMASRGTEHTEHTAVSAGAELRASA